MSFLPAGRARRWLALSAAAALVAGCSDRSLTNDRASETGEHPPTSAPPAPQVASFSVAGEQTFTEVINSGYHFGEYLYYNGDWGWQHRFPLYNTPGVTITSAKLYVYAYDVDAEPSQGLNGEYDAISVDGTRLNPGYLQGANATWSTTTFDVPVSAITDDGNVNVAIDIDIYHNSPVWATQLNSSTLVVTYTLGPVNQAPYLPTLSGTPAGNVEKNQSMTVNVTGPAQPDPDNDPVTYEYRWFLDTGTGGYLDPSVHGRGTFTGSTVPASATQLGDHWRVQVTPRDDKGAIGPYATFTFGAVVPVSDQTPPVITPKVVGTQGSNDWYTSDVTVSFTVTDAESAISNEVGCGTLTINTNQAGQEVSCSATSSGGTSTSKVTIKRDATAPTISGTATGTHGAGDWFIDDVAIAFTASDDISGVSSTAACAKTQTTDTDGHTYDCTVTNGAGLTATASVGVKRDKSAPVITPTIVGPQGNNGWYTGNVNVSFATSDNVSGITSAPCAASSLTTDTPSQSYSCAATNGAGLQNSVTVTVKRDATKPSVAIVGNAGSYTVDQTVSIGCSISDALSNIATQSCNGASGAAYTLGLGAHAVSASATDNAGNANGASGSFTVNATTTSVCALVQRWVSAAGIAKSMCSKLDNAQAAFDRGSIGAGDNQLDALINEIDAQSGKAISSSNAATLVSLTGALKK